MAALDRCAEQLDIRTSFCAPPIPIRSCDWSAWVDGCEESWTGYGPTKEAAIADLLEQIGEERA